jgi:NAD-dependent dihydropyrimidine dehydrogenase PreA subunit
MPYVIAEPCVATCVAACVDVCPVDCIHGPTLPEPHLPEGERRARLAGLQLYIDPGECICCGACAPVCPVEAIFEEEDLPPEWERYRALNAQFFRGGGG